MKQTYIDISKIMKALSDPKRLRIVDMLSQGELCARNIQTAFNISQPTLSHDMRVLKEAGITAERRDGKNIFYSLDHRTLHGLKNSLALIFNEESSYLSPDDGAKAK